MGEVNCRVITNFKVAFSSFGAVAMPLRIESVGSSTWNEPSSWPAVKK